MSSVDSQTLFAIWVSFSLVLLCGVTSVLGWAARLRRLSARDRPQSPRRVE